jgi:mannose-1-phosphate guanylyltransferase
MKKAAIIMAGGTGSKFWPMSRADLPKQFNYMQGEGTLLQNTFKRIKRYIPEEDIFIVTSDKQKENIEEQLPEINYDNVIYEPFERNTAPCVALASIYMRNRGYDRETVIYIFPADHVIENEREYFNALETAAETAFFRDSIVTVGVEPTRPETQYGYIQVDMRRGDLGSLYDMGVRYTTTFAEKPDIETAKRFIESGDFLWNSGMLVMKKGIFDEAFDRYLPEYSDRFGKLYKYIGTDKFPDELKYAYKQINPISLDFGILEKASNVYCVDSAFTWSDLSTWDELWRISMKDANRNVIRGEAVSIGNEGSLILSGDKMVGIIGIEDVVVINTDDAVLICKKGETDRVQEIVDYLKRKNINRFL